MLNRSIVLVGFMGTGKSTVARLLSERLRMPLVDLDARIVESTGLSIADIFAHQGEAAFRQLETEALFAAVAADEGAPTGAPPVIVSTGGGAVLAERNRAIMLAHAVVVCLTAREELLVARVAGDTARPLLQGEDVAAKVGALLKARRDAYTFAHVTIDTSDLSPEQVCERIVDHMQRLGSEANTHE